MRENAKGHVVIRCGYQGVSYQSYELARNPKTSQVALKWQGMLVTDPLDTLAVRFYDGLVMEVERLRMALEGHRKGLDSGWGDASIDDRLMPKHAGS